MRSLFLIITLCLLSGCVTQTPVANRSQQNFYQHIQSDTHRIENCERDRC